MPNSDKMSTPPKIQLPEEREELERYVDSAVSKIPRNKRADFLRHLRADAELILKHYQIQSESEKYGECYFVFMANEPADRVMKGLVELRNKTNAPSALELALYTRLEEVPRDANLPRIWVERADFYKGKDYPDNHYMLRGRIINSTNEIVFNHLDNIRAVLLNERKPFKISNQSDGEYCDDIYVKIDGRYEISLDGKTAPYRD